MVYIAVFAIGYLIGAVCFLLWLQDQHAEICDALAEAIDEEKKGEK